MIRLYTILGLAEEPEVVAVSRLILRRDIWLHASQLYCLLKLCPMRCDSKIFLMQRDRSIGLMVSGISLPDTWVSWRRGSATATGMHLVRPKIENWKDNDILLRC